MRVNFTVIRPQTCPHIPSALWRSDATRKLEPSGQIYVVTSAYERRPQGGWRGAFKAAPFLELGFLTGHIQQPLPLSRPGETSCAPASSILADHLRDIQQNISNLQAFENLLEGRTERV
jgi:hypothetical protein